MIGSDGKDVICVGEYLCILVKTAVKYFSQIVHNWGGGGVRGFKKKEE